MPKGKTLVLKKMTESEQRLVEENLNLVHYILHKNTWIKNDFYNDYFQMAAFGLCLAAQRFDESKEFKFATFATAYIEGYIKRHHRDFENGPIKPTRSSLSNNRTPDYLYLDGIINENGDCYGYDFIEGEENKEIDIIEQLDFERIKSQLSERENCIIDLFLDNLGQVEIGHTLGISQPQVSRYKAKLRKKFENYLRRI